MFSVSHGNLSNIEGFYFCLCRKEVSQLLSFSEPAHFMNHKLIHYCYLPVVVMKTSHIFSHLEDKQSLAPLQSQVLKSVTELQYFRSKSNRVSKDRTQVKMFQVSRELQNKYYI